MTTEEIENKLVSAAEEDYKKFTLKLVPQAKSVLGVRLPLLRKIAKEVARNDYRDFLLREDLSYYEEVMLQGLVIGYAKMTMDERIDSIARFVPKIDNWAVCDSFCNTLKKVVLKDKPAFWEIISSYGASEQCYDVRFSAVMMLHYIDEEYIDKIFKLITRMTQEEYYAYMAIAWLVSICYIDFPEKTSAFLKQNLLPKKTHNKAIQKITESRQVELKKKVMIRGLKR